MKTCVKDSFLKHLNKTKQDGFIFVVSDDALDDFCFCLKDATNNAFTGISLRTSAEDDKKFRLENLDWFMWLSLNTDKGDCIEPDWKELVCFIEEHAMTEDGLVFYDFTFKEGVNSLAEAMAVLIKVYAKITYA